MSPFPSSRVIHAEWARHHLPTAEGSFTAVCTITHGGTEGTWDPVNGSTPGTVNTLYTGVCRVRALPQQRPAVVDAADQLTAKPPYQVAITREAAVAVPVGASVTITAVDDNGDVHIVGARLTVESVHTASLAWEYVLNCTRDTANQSDGGTP